MQRIRNDSPFGRLEGWRLASFIVKAGDDLRQEQVGDMMTWPSSSQGGIKQAGRQAGRQLPTHQPVAGCSSYWIGQGGEGRQAADAVCVVVFQVAMQMMSLCLEVFREEGLDLWLRPYNILCVGDQAGEWVGGA